MRTEQTEEKKKINHSPELKFHRAEHFQKKIFLGERVLSKKHPVSLDI